MFDFILNVNKIIFFYLFCFYNKQKKSAFGADFFAYSIFKADLHKEGIYHKILLLQFLFLLIFLHPDNFDKPDK